MYARGLAKPGQKISGLPPPRATNEKSVRNSVWDRLATRIQPKLTVGAVDDPLEQEADRVADQVMRMPDPAAPTAPGALAATSSPPLRRACAACEEEEVDKKLQIKASSTFAVELAGFWVCRRHVPRVEDVRAGRRAQDRRS